MYSAISRYRVIALVLAGIAAAVASAANGAGAGVNSIRPQNPDQALDATVVSYASLSDEALQAEILRRSKALLMGNAPEVETVMMELAQAPRRYRTLVGRILGLYKSAQIQLTVDAPELREIEELRRQHTELMEEARAAGLLLTDQQQALWDQHRSDKLVINGVPWECMTFDAETATKAMGFRRRQWDLLLQMEKKAKEYAEKAYEDDIKRVNRHLEKRYLAALDYRDNHQGWRKRLRALAKAPSGDYEHLLGTRPNAAWASLRARAFRLPADKIPGMDVVLLAPVKLQLAPTLPLPELPDEFRMLWDGEKIYERWKAVKEEAAAADRWMLWLESHHTLLRSCDILRSFVAAPWDPSVAAWRRGENFSNALLAGFPRFGQHFTWDMLVGMCESAERLGTGAWNGAAAAANDPGDVLRDLWEAAKSAPGKWKTLLDANSLFIPIQDDFDDTPEGRLAYLAALDKYQDDAQGLMTELKPINEELDKAINLSMDALNVFLLARGIRGGGGYFLANQARWRQNTAKWMENLGLRRQGKSKAQEISDNPSAYTREARQAAEEYMKKEEEVGKKAEEGAEIEDAFWEEMYGRETRPDLPPEVQQRIEQRAAEYSSDYTPPANPRGPATFRAKDGQVFEAVEHIGQGEFGDVYRLADGTVLKVFKEGTADHLTDPLANMQREVAGAELAEQAGVHVTNLEGKSGVLADGTPYIIKELVPPENILGNYLRDNHYNLPASYQQAVLDLVQKLSEAKLFGGDLNMNNIYFRTMADGSAKACLLEGDFIKAKPNMSAQQVLEANLNVLVATGDVSMAIAIIRAEFPEVTGLVGSAGALTDIIHYRVAELFKERYGVRCDFEAMLRASDAMAENLLEFKPKAKTSGTGLAELKKDMPKIDEHWEQYGLDAVDVVPENIFELPKVEDVPIGPEPPPNLNVPNANP